MTRLLFATAIVVAFTVSANAQRCPAGADAFLNCLPLDHRYGGPGEISRPQLQEHKHISGKGHIATTLPTSLASVVVQQPPSSGAIRAHCAR